MIKVTIEVERNYGDNLIAILHCDENAYANCQRVISNDGAQNIEVLRALRKASNAIEAVLAAVETPK